jgi:cytochrome P450
MNVNRLRFSFQGLSYLESASSAPDRALLLRTSPAPHLLVWSAADIGQIFRSDRLMWLEHSDTLRPLLGDSSLLFANGTRHEAYRQVIGPALRGKQLDSWRPVIKAAVEDAADECIKAGSFVTPEWARQLTLGIIRQILLGPEASSGYWAECRELLRRVSDLVESALGSSVRTLRYRYLRLPTALPSPWRAFLRERDTIRRDLLALVELAAGTGRTNVTCPGLVVALTSGSPPLGRIGDSELADQLMSLIFAGHETTASAIAWTLYWLACHDQIRADVRAELAASSADGSSVTDSPLLDAVCREVLRISPPATVAGNRVLADEQALLGRRLPKGTTLTPCIHLVHRQPDVYHHPERFAPDRFLAHKWSAQHYLPFGGGTRRCLGADLAVLEMRMAVAALLRRADLRCLNPRAGTPHRRGPAMGPAPTLTMAVRPCAG